MRYTDDGFDAAAPSVTSRPLAVLAAIQTALDDLKQQIGEAGDFEFFGKVVWVVGYSHPVFEPAGEGNIYYPITRSQDVYVPKKGQTL